MANISVYLAKIKSAIYGEEVRGSIHDAIEAMNDESSEAKEAAITAKNSAANSASAAKTSETNAKSSETNAANSAVEAAISETNASTYANNASVYSTNAANSAIDAAQSENNAYTYSMSAGVSAETAKISEDASKISETNSKEYCDSAELSKASALKSASDALEYSDSARESANEAAESVVSATNSAKSYAVGGTGTRENEDMDNAKYYAEQAKNIAGGDFVTNSVYNTHVNDINNPHGVDKNQIGLDNVDNTSDADKPVSIAMQEALDEKADQIDMLNNEITTLRSDTLTFKNIALATSDFTSNTDSDYPYKSEITCTGVTTNHVPFVVFDKDSAATGIFAPYAETTTGKVIIYAVKPAACTIESIVCTRG